MRWDTDSSPRHFFHIRKTYQTCLEISKILEKKIKMVSFGICHFKHVIVCHSTWKFEYLNTDSTDGIHEVILPSFYFSFIPIPGM